MSVETPALSKLLGGPLGRHVRRGGVWFQAAPWAYLLLTVNYLLLMLRQLPCLIGNGEGNLFPKMCYTDISVLYYWRGLKDGLIPYLQSDLEYPVLTGAMMEFSRRLVMLFGGSSEPNLTSAQVAHSANLFFGITAVLLFVLFAVLVWSHLQLHRPWDALMIAVSPAILTAGLINWDALVIALTALAILGWARRQPVWAGIWLGLAISAKLYPVLLLVPLVVLCLRTGRIRQLWTTVWVTAVSWLAVNLPIYLATPSGWSSFWSYNATRGGDLGSLWYVLSLAGFKLGSVSGIETLLMVVGTGLICGLLLLSPSRARLGQGIFLIVALFLMVNKVYSPQYVLWLLPLLVLARPKWLDWTVFAIAETIYYVAIWAHLGGVLSSGTSQDRLYWVAVFLRIGATGWLCYRVVRDILRPRLDPVREGDADDPDGGVLDGAEDAGWVTRLRESLDNR